MLQALDTARSVATGAAKAYQAGTMAASKMAVAGGSVAAQQQAAVKAGLKSAADSVAESVADGMTDSGVTPRALVNAFHALAKGAHGVNILVIWKCDECQCDEGLLWDVWGWVEIDSSPWVPCPAKGGNREQFKRAKERIEDGHARAGDIGGAAVFVSHGYHSPEEAWANLPRCFEHALNLCRAKHLTPSSGGGQGAAQK